MPKRNDLQKLLIIGSGPIVIGQACEFDYSGTQACRALREEGYKVVLINSNPATIMTDPDMAYRTYIEPLTAEAVERVIEKEKPQALLPTLGGQTALNLAVELEDTGVLNRHGVELIGSNSEIIKTAEERDLFKTAMQEAGLETVESVYINSIGEALQLADRIGYPLVIRPSFTLGGSGGGIAYNEKELREKVAYGLHISPLSQVLVEEGVLGWKEVELEVMRDRQDNTVVVCSIENFDPMGVHTGESITVAPVQTLTDREYQVIRNAALAALRKIGVTTGGCNLQFAFDPESDRVVVIEMNPRVSRSSALASKATGFPIAKIAAKLAVGYTLDEIPNDITRQTPASFEPSLDYCVVKIPRWDFAKFPEADPTLTTQMKSVGEIMSIGRTFKEAVHKAVRSLEQGSYGLKMPHQPVYSPEELKEIIKTPLAERIYYLAEAMRHGITCNEIYRNTGINPWFLEQLQEIIDLEKRLLEKGYHGMEAAALVSAKEHGFSDLYLGELLEVGEEDIRRKRMEHHIKPSYRCVDTCAGEFEAYTPYFYSTYENHNEIPASSGKKIMILGSGPNRIGQGVEFDYCCVQAAFALREEGYEVIMVNCNPETVSTDYDISDRLYFEPLTLEDVLHIYQEEEPDGIILQFGGQTPLKLALPLLEKNVRIWGTSPADIDRAENRREFAEIVEKLNLQEPPYATAASGEEAMQKAVELGLPVLVRPSYVLGGQSMQIVYSAEKLEAYLQEQKEISPQNPLLLDKFLEGAIELDVDAVCDGEDVFIGGLMEHVEHAGVHSGDSSCVLPPFSLKEEHLEEVRRQTRLLARELNVVGLCNIQFAVRDDTVYLIEANPRASRTVPFVSKAIGISLAKVAAKVMAGEKLIDLGLVEEITPSHFSVKEAVLPFTRFPGVDIILGPEMRSTGEVMGVDTDFSMAFAKSQLAAGTPLPLQGNIFITVADRDKREIIDLAGDLVELGFNIFSTSGTASVLRSQGIQVEEVYKLQEGSPNILDYIDQNEVALIINTPAGASSRSDEARMRQTAVAQNVPIITTIRAARAATEGMKTMHKEGLQVKSIQEYIESLPE